MRGRGTAIVADSDEDVPDQYRLQFRIGIHVGDVMVKEGDLFGEDVNIAARLQAFADAGGICISARHTGMLGKPYLSYTRSLARRG